MSDKSAKSTEKGQNDIFDPDFSKLAEAIATAAERTQPLIQDFFQKHSLEELSDAPLDPYNIRRTYLEYMMRLFNDPQRFADVQVEFWEGWVKLWQNSMDRFLEGQDKPPIYSPEKTDRRFKSNVWQENALFDFIKQSYLLTSQTIMKSVHDLKDIDPSEKQKLEFFARQYVNAIAPNNFVMTNPEVIEETLKTGGDNLVRGLENLLEDLERGGGELTITTTDYQAFEVGRNLATSPGKVIYQNDLIQLIQYEPKTKDVFKRPLLIIPPWINKYYILDLKPENSFIAWLIDQGHTVFTISWINPDEKLADKGFEDYMNEGCAQALHVIQDITGEDQINAIGYCLGGTLLACFLAWQAAEKPKNKSKNKDALSLPEITSATFLTTLVDFEKAGDMKVFIDDAQIEMMEKKMAKTGYLEAKAIRQTFSMMRSTDLIWSFVVNNYLLGREPFPFDLLYWNEDSTNMPAKMHSFYLRHMYRDNQLVKPGGITIDGRKIDMRKVKTPSYFLSTKEDHIAPWQATYQTTQLFGGEKTFTLAASGHIAGVVNHPDNKKYHYYLNPKTPEDPESWLDKAVEHPGSWWTHWQDWMAPYIKDTVPARKIGEKMSNKKYPPIEDAPGSYVKKRF